MKYYKFTAIFRSFQAMMKEMKQEEKKMRNMIRLGEEIQADSALSEESNLKLGQELNALKNRWKSLEEKINWRMQRYVM